MENQPVSVKSITTMGINLLRDVLKTTTDPAMKDRIEKRIKYLQDKYKNKKAKKPTCAGSNQSTSSMDSVDINLANEIKVIPFEEPLPMPRPYCELKDVPIPIARHLSFDEKVQKITQNIESKNSLREFMDSINNNNFEIAELNIKLIKKI